MKLYNYLILSISFILLFSCSPTKYIYTEGEVFNEIQEAVSTLAADDMHGRETGTAGEIMAAKYIMSEFVEIGIQAFPNIGGYLQPFIFTANAHFEADRGHPSGTSIGHNVIGYLDHGEEDWIVIGAHYDHLGMGGLYSKDPDVHEVHNGADDNASGVAAILAIARQLKHADLDYNVLIIAFSGEEFGLWGSKYFVEELPIAKKSIKFMLNFDMVGRLSSNKDIVVHGTGTSPIWTDVLMDSNKKYNYNLVHKESGSGPSDHTSFYNSGIPVLFLFTGQHDDYHKASDDIDKINFIGIHGISMFATDLIHATQDYDNIPFTKTKDVQKKKMDFKVSLGVTPDYVFQGTGLKIDGVRSDRPAMNAGILKGDIVIKIGEYEIKDIYKYMEVLGKYNVGDETEITVIRGEEVLTFPLKW